MPAGDGPAGLRDAGPAPRCPPDRSAVRSSLRYRQDPTNDPFRPPNPLTSRRPPPRTALAVKGAEAHHAACAPAAADRTRTQLGSLFYTILCIFRALFRSDCANLMRILHSFQGSEQSERPGRGRPTNQSPAGPATWPSGGCRGEERMTDRKPTAAENAAPRAHLRVQRREPAHQREPRPRDRAERGGGERPGGTAEAGGRARLRALDAVLGAAVLAPPRRARTFVRPRS